MKEGQLEKLKAVKKLLDDGVLTEEEFARTKQKILSEDSVSSSQEEALLSEEKKKTFLIVGIISVLVVISIVITVLIKSNADKTTEPYILPSAPSNTQESYEDYGADGLAGDGWDSTEEEEYGPDGLGGDGW